MIIDPRFAPIAEVTSETRLLVGGLYIQELVSRVTPYTGQWTVLVIPCRWRLGAGPLVAFASSLVNCSTVTCQDRPNHEIDAMPIILCMHMLLKDVNNVNSSLSLSLPMCGGLLTKL